MKHFPFDHDRYELTMNARAGISALIEVDRELYAAQIALKNEILASDYAYYFQCPLDAEPLAWEALALLLPNMARHDPQCFTLERNGRRWVWTNRLLEQTTEFVLGDSGTLPWPPLDWLGRQVQEDLILMARTPDGDESVCAAGQLCFGSAWCLADKMDLRFGQIHAAVPEFDARIGRASHLMMQRLKAGRPTARLNWTVSTTSQLNLAPLLRPEWERTQQGITPENAGDRCWLRVERQTFSRLPEMHGILFTIRTHLTPFREIAADPERRRRAAGVIAGIPAGTRHYKDMDLYAAALIAYLESVSC